MCRIAGIANHLSQSEAEQKVRSMCTLMQHGGPDDEGFYSSSTSNIVLGHRRLSLIDLSPLGHQPMIYQDRYIISFNGEIYNFPELKRQLKEEGMSFKTESDTEVILAAFSKWNTLSFAKLKGMFAFALFDSIEKLLYLVRDPAGIKPLYYSAKDGSLQFSSEMRAFSVFNDKQSNPQWPIYQLAYGHIPEPVTTLQDVHPLHKGCFLKYNLPDKKLSYQSFQHYSYSNTLTDPYEANEVIRRSVHGAVGRHLLSDAPIGVFLSGGIDSSIVTTAAADYKHNHLQTLSIYFDDPDFSEKKYQDIIIEQLQCKSYQHLLDQDEFEHSFPGILQAMDMPSCDGINTWFISRYAKKQGLKAVLSGIGSDELFGGYPSFARMPIAEKMQKFPDSIIRLARFSNVKKVNRASYLSLGGIKGLYLFLRGHYIPLQIARHLDASESEVWNVLNDHPMSPRLTSLSDKNKASWMELNMYMQNQLLRDADVMSMAHGVEIRVPFLDDDVIHTASRIEASLKYAGAIPKQILVHAFKDKLPEAIWNRQKMGFSFPFMKWFSQSPFVKDSMENTGKAARDTYKKFLEGKLHWSHLMSLIILKSRKVI